MGPLDAHGGAWLVCHRHAADGLQLVGAGDGRLAGGAAHSRIDCNPFLAMTAGCP